jgi:hypothetical protein
MCAAICDNTKHKYMSSQKQNEFERAAAEEKRPGFFAELWGFLRENKKWWLLPIVIMFLLFALLILLNAVAPGLAPFIYTLF